MSYLPKKEKHHVITDRGMGCVGCEYGAVEVVHFVSASYSQAHHDPHPVFN